jgi:hypothetical protein
LLHAWVSLQIWQNMMLRFLLVSLCKPKNTELKWVI